MSTTTLDEPLLTRTQVAEYLGVSPRWLADNARIGPPRIRVNGNTVRYDPKAVREWVKARTIRS